MELKSIKVDPDVKRALKLRACKNDRTIKKELDLILREVLTEAGDLIGSK